MNKDDQLSRDTEWLLKQGREDIDPKEFSEWVTRVCADGVSENGARVYVLSLYNTN